MKKKFGILFVSLLVAACAGQPRPSPEVLIRGISFRQERISILSKECAGEVSYGHLQMCAPHRTCVKDRTHVKATRSACSALAVDVGENTNKSQIEQSYGKCLFEASQGKSRVAKAKQEHMKRQKDLCGALYNERSE